MTWESSSVSRPTPSSPRHRRSFLAPRRPSARRPTPRHPPSTSRCRACSRCSIAAPSSARSASDSPSGERSAAAASSRARTTSIPIFRRATRSRSTKVPVVQGGTLTIAAAEGEQVVRLTRAHLEEDAGKSLHEDYRGMSGIDLNRAGTPLLEIVSEPDLRSAADAVTYARTLHALVRWIGICDGNMQEGSFRCDANVSVRRKGERQARHALRDQEPQQLPLPAARDRVRSAAPDRADRRRWHDRPGDATLRSRSRRDAPDAQQGRRAGLSGPPRSRPAAARHRRRVDRAGERSTCRSCRRR